MGVIADLLATAKSIDTSVPHEGNDRAVVRQLRSLISEGREFSYPSSCVAANEIQSVAVHVTATGGTYTLTVTLSDGTTFTTAAIARTGNTAAIQSAINTAAAGVTGYVANDLLVAGGPLSTTPVTLTFGGAVGSQKPGLTVIDGSSLTYTGGAAVLGAATTTTQGTGSVDEVQHIAQYGNTVNGGHFKLVLNLLGASPITTADILYSANAAAITTAIDTAVTAASYPAWTNGDIVVSGGTLLASGGATLVLTFSGASVTHANHGQTTITDHDLTATVTGTPGAITVSTDGQTNRSAWGLLMSLSIISSAPPVQGVAPTAPTVVNTRGKFPFGLDNETVVALIEEAAIQDNQKSVETVLKTALNLA